MFENYKELSAEEKARVKAAFKAIRAELGFGGDRYRNLAWGFIRGFKFRRIERAHHMQPLPEGAFWPGPQPGYVITPEGRFIEHNLPSALLLTQLLAKHLPEFQDDIVKTWNLKPGCRVEAWLADPSGAIPVPVRVRKVAA